MNLFPKMATLRNKRKLAALSRKTLEYPRNNQSQNSSPRGITEEYIPQVSEEIEGRVTKKLSHEISRTKSRILGPLSKLDEFLLNPQVLTFSGTVPGTFRNADVENQEPSGDRSQNDLHPEVEFSTSRATNLTDSEPDETSHRYLSFPNVHMFCKVFLEWFSGYLAQIGNCFNFSYCSSDSFVYPATTLRIKTLSIVQTES